MHVGSSVEHAAARARDAKIKLWGSQRRVLWSWYDEKQATGIPVPEEMVVSLWAKGRIIANYVLVQAK